MNVAYEAAVDQFEAWLSEGVRKGWVTPIHCLTHDGPKLDDIEEESEDDLCIPIVVVRGPQ